MLLCSLRLHISIGDENSLCSMPELNPWIQKDIEDRFVYLCLHVPVGNNIHVTRSMWPQVVLFALLSDEDECNKSVKLGACSSWSLNFLNFVENLKMVTLDIKH